MVTMPGNANGFATLGALLSDPKPNPKLKPNPKPITLTRTLNANTSTKPSPTLTPGAFHAGFGGGVGGPRCHVNPH